MELYIIRHGQSTNNTLTDPRGRVCDPPLTELGRRQVALLTQHLAGATSRAPGAEGQKQPGLGITRLYCSPMRRALETAQPLGQALGVAPEVWIDVHEFGGIYLDYGAPTGVVAYPGKTRSEILAGFPHYRLPEGITEQGWWRGGREERVAFYARAARVAETLRQWAGEDERIAIVSHGDFSNGLLHALFNLSPEQGVYYHHPNTAISRIDFQGDGRLDVRYVSRVDHLPPELIS